MKASNGLRAIIGIRLGAGVVAYLAPDALSSPLGGSSGSTPLMTRLFAARDFGYAVSVLLVPAASRRRLLQVGIATDLADALAAGLHLSGRRVGRAVGVGAVASALTAAAFGLIAIRPAKPERG